MKKFKIYSTLAVAFLSTQVLAQDNNDLNVATHQMDVNVPELALIDIHDANTGAEAGVISFDLAGDNNEAGLYSFDSELYTDLYLNYTSVTGSSASGFDVTRQILVRFESGSFPQSLDLRITPEAPVLTIADGGTADSAGDVTPGGVALGASNPIGTDALLVNSIESVYTGDEVAGVRLTYTLEQNGNFAQYQAGAYSAVIRYTLTDL